MSETDFLEKTRLGRTDLQVSRIGLASGYGITGDAAPKAHEDFGVNYFYWDRRKSGMRDLIRALCATGREITRRETVAPGFFQIWWREDKCSRIFFSGFG